MIKCKSFVDVIFFIAKYVPQLIPTDYIGFEYSNRSNTTKSTVYLQGSIPAYPWDDHTGRFPQVRKTVTVFITKKEPQRRTIIISQRMSNTTERIIVRVLCQSPDGY